MSLTKDNIKLQNWKEKLSSYNIARSNRFTFEYNSIRPDTNTSNLKFLVRNAYIPSVSIEGPQIKWKGRSYKLHGDVTYEQMNITFINDEKWEARDFFEKEINYIRNIESLNNGSTIKQLIDSKNSTLTHYKGNNDPLSIYSFSNCYPISVSAISLSHDNAGDLETFSVIFNYYRIN